MTTQVSRQSQGLKNMDHVLLAIFCFPSFESPHSKPKMADLQRRKNAISHICMTSCNANLVELFHYHTAYLYARIGALGPQKKVSLF